MTSKQHVEACRVLAAAAKYIKTHGWIQHKLVDSKGAVCAIGAIRAVDRGFTVHARRLLCRFLRLPAGGSIAAIAAWNDSSVKNGDEVIAAMRGAAKPMSRWPKRRTA